MLKELLVKEQKIVNHFFESVKLETIEKLLNQMIECKGLIIFTGIGKSALIAKKIAETLTSIGNRAIFLSPENALHGDIGVISDKDICIFLSKSGESDELLHLVPFIRNKGAQIISVVCREKSRLSKAAHLNITLPLTSELCAFDLVPTASCVIQLVFGDILTVALMKKKKFTKEDYIKNHPAGRIGKRMTLKVCDLMIKGELIPQCKLKDILVDTLVELSNKRCGTILVLDDHFHLQGIFTDGDLRRALLKEGAQVLKRPMEELMTKSARCISPYELAVEALKEMEKDPKKAITVLPVIEDSGLVVGLIRLHDIVQSGI